MEIKTGKLTITNYDYTNKEHRLFAYKLTSEDGVNKYISRNFEERIKDSSPENRIVFPSSYLVKDNDNIVSYIRFNELNFLGAFKFECAIHPNLRRLGYGKLILVETTDYLFTNVDEIKEIILDIDMYNYPSQKCAESCGYQKVKRVDKNYQYSMKKPS